MEYILWEQTLLIISRLSIRTGGSSPDINVNNCALQVEVSTRAYIVITMMTNENVVFNNSAGVRNLKLYHDGT